MTPDQKIDPDLLDQTRREIQRLVSEIEQLVGGEMEPNQFFGEFLRRLVLVLAAPAGAVWLKTPDGQLQLAGEVNIAATGLTQPSKERQVHEELLTYIATTGKSCLIPPGSGPSEHPEFAQIANPLPFVLLIAPISIESGVLGFIEVFQDPSRPAAALPGYLKFVVKMAAEAARFLKSRRFRDFLSQEQLWNQLDAFVRSVHGGLNPKQVAFLLANDGRKLIGCERVSVAVRKGKKTRIESISGQDVVEKRSNLVVRQAKLCDRVIHHGENVVYHGTVDPDLPGDLTIALQAYLEESNSRFVSVILLRDQRESASHARPTAAIVVEMIEDQELPKDLASRIELVSRHGADAMYNALDVAKIPLLPVWRGIGDMIESAAAFGVGKLTVGLVVTVAALLTFMLMPWPLRLEGKGELVPENRQILYAPADGIVQKVVARHRMSTTPTTVLAQLVDPELEREKLALQGQIKQAEQTIRNLATQRGRRGDDPELRARLTEAEQNLANYRGQLAVLNRKQVDMRVVARLRGDVVDLKPEDLLNKPVRKGDPLFTIAEVDGRWILEVAFPENAVTHIARARMRNPDGKVPVSFVLSSNPETTYHGTLLELGTQVETIEQNHVVRAKIALDENEDVAKNISVVGVEVRARADCGPHALGYVLFRELIDFVREYTFW